MSDDETLARYRRDASGVVWRVTVRGVELGGRWEVSDMQVESRGRGRLTATLLHKLEGELGAMRDDLDGAAAARSSGHEESEDREDESWLAGIPAEPDDVDQVALAREWSGAAPTAEPPAQLSRRRGPARDDDVWRQRAEALAGAWADRRPLIDALRQLDPEASESALRQRIARARRWDREANGGKLLAGVGYGRGGRS